MYIHIILVIMSQCSCLTNASYFKSANNENAIVLPGYDERN